MLKNYFLHISIEFYISIYIFYTSIYNFFISIFNFTYQLILFTYQPTNLHINLYFLHINLYFYTSIITFMSSLQLTFQIFFHKVKFPLKNAKQSRNKWSRGSKSNFLFTSSSDLMGLFVYFKDILPFSHFVQDEKFIRRRQT